MRDTLGTTVLALTLCFALPAAAQREERFTRTLDVGPNAALSLENISGDIHVEGAPGSSIVIDAVKSVDDEEDSDLLAGVEVEVSQMGNRVRVSTEHTGRGRGRRGGHDSVSVSYRVRVPKGTEVELQSVSGSVTLIGVDGAANVQSVSGEVSASDVSDLVQAKSVSGNVEVNRARSRRRAEIGSVSGDVAVVGIQAAELNLSSVSGDVRIDDVSSERATLESVSGDIAYTGSITGGGRYEFQSHSGDVIITLGDEVGFELEASTFSGEIESEFPLQTTSMAQKGRRLSAVVGDGSAIIEATTFSGDVELRRTGGR